MFDLKTLETAIASCGRRKIAAIVSNDMGVQLGCGANGPLCGGCDCPARGTKPGTGPADCYGIHAEIRALFDVKPWLYPEMHTIECTKAPCLACTRVLLGTPIQRIVFNIASNETENRDLWLAAGRVWEQA